MNFLKKLFKIGTGPEQIAHKIVMYIAQGSFNKFREDQFRTWLAFEKIAEEEQDRIFNELVVTGLSLAYLTLEQVEAISADSLSKQMLRNIHNNVASSYVRHLKSLGVASDLAELWYALLAKRCEEYRKDYTENKQYFTDPKQNHWIHICAIGGQDHIRRGEAKPEDPLLRDLTRWCAQISNGIQKIIMDETITRKQ